MNKKQDMDYNTKGNVLKKVMVWKSFISTARVMCSVKHGLVL